MLLRYLAVSKEWIFVMLELQYSLILADAIFSLPGSLKFYESRRLRTQLYFHSLPFVVHLKHSVYSSEYNLSCLPTKSIFVRINKS